MNIINNGFITLNNIKYNYKIFDTIGLIDLINHDKKFTKMFEKYMQDYRKYSNLNISKLVKEWFNHKSDDIITYFIIYKNDVIISTLKFNYNLDNKYGFISMVYTNPEYRGQKICQINVEYIINLTKKYIKTYELTVDIDNISALKCYENNGFKIVKKREYRTSKKEYYLMKLIIVP